MEDVEEELQHAKLEMKKTTNEKLEEVLHKMPAPNEPTPIMQATAYEIPFDEHLQFVGREEELEQIHDALFLQTPNGVKTPSSSRPRSFVIHGMGGMGKSEIALRYAYKHRADYQCIFWIDAETSESLSTSYVKVAASINLLRVPHEIPHDKLRRDLHEWLRKTGMPLWSLLIVSAW